VLLSSHLADVVEEHASVSNCVAGFYVAVASC